MKKPTFWLEGVPTTDVVLIVLNQPIVHVETFERAWRSCPHRVVTDGAAQRLMKLDREDFIPDLIIGDFDSITPQAREFYTAKSVPFLNIEDQYSTDFMKAMARSVQLWPETKTFVAFGGLGGRIDHEWHAYLNLARSLEQDGHPELLLVSTESLTFALPMGSHEIETPLKWLGDTAGFAPLLGSSTVTTTGFEWDVENWPMSFATQISTSNFVRKDAVSIIASDPVVMTFELRY